MVWPNFDYATNGSYIERQSQSLIDLCCQLVLVSLSLFGSSNLEAVPMKDEKRQSISCGYGATRFISAEFDRNGTTILPGFLNRLSAALQHQAVPRSSGLGLHAEFPVFVKRFDQFGQKV